MKISNIHSHIVPCIDDGAENMTVAMNMIDMEYNQGTRLLVCSSHNGYSKEYVDGYLRNFQKLQEKVKEKYPYMTLLPANEVYCGKEDIDEIIYLLSAGEILSINNTKYVLTEFSPFIPLENARYVINRLLSAGWIPVIAHLERYFYLYNEEFLKDIIEKGVLIQCNLFSFADESSAEIKRRARMLLENKYIHFVGSDCHSDTWRSPSLSSGAEYILENAPSEYAENILSLNAKSLFL